MSMLFRYENFYTYTRPNNPQQKLIYQSSENVIAVYPIIHST